MSSKNITLNTVVCQNDGIIDSRIDHELVMMSVQKGKYYGMDDIGSRIWELLKTPCAVKDLIHALVAEYAVDPGTCEQDVVPFLERLKAEDIIRVHT